MRNSTRACVVILGLTVACSEPPADEAAGSAALAGETTIIARADPWDINADYEPIDPDWNQPGAQLGALQDTPAGYGEPYLATVFSMPVGDGPPTTYFRRYFYLDDPDAVQALRGEVMYDDGVVIYLNGVRIDALSMPSGTITQSTLALGHEANNSYVSRDWTAARAQLRAGANLIAVELHQVTRASSDAVFDVALHAVIGTPTPPGEDIARGAVWAFWDRGGDLGTAWRGPAYDDSPWGRGPGVLGYGESYVATTVSYGADAGNKHRTTYFRNRFRVADADLVTAMTADVMYDDGAVIYLNGTEVRRLSMPAGTITASTFALGHETGSYTRLDLASARALLVDGDNVIAVEVHQVSASSSDLTFDLALDVTSGQPPPPAGSGIPRGALWKAFTGPSEPGPCCWDYQRSLDFDDRSWLVVRAPAGYGEPYVRGVLPFGPDPEHKYNAAYFRNTFFVEDPARVTSLFADVMYDDGVVLYLNGSEVARRSMPSGFIQHSTAARWHEANNTYETIDLAAVRGALRPGPNLIVARVHQDDPGSSDLVFDLSIRITEEAPATTISRGAPWLFYWGGALPAGWQTSRDHTGWRGDYAPIDGGPGTPTTVYYRRRFTVPSVSAVTELRGELRYEDGAIVYLNGVEIARRNLPSGAVGFDTPALGDHDGADYEVLDWNAFRSHLRTGENIIAVEVHQEATPEDEYDETFDLAVEVVTAATPRIAGCSPATPSPRGGFSGVWIAPAGDVWIAGGGLVGRRRAGGVYAWCRIEANNGPVAVWGSADDDVWLVGPEGLAYRWDGGDFDPLDLDTERTLMDVWGSSASDVFVVGAGGVIRHFDGQAWTTADVVTGTLNGVWGAGATDVWAVGRRSYDNDGLSGCDSEIWRWNPTTRQFALERAFVNEHGGCGFEGVHGTGRGDVWAVGDDFPAGAAAGYAMSAHHDGVTWSRNSPPDELQSDRTYMDVAAGAPGAEGGAWVVAAGDTAVFHDGVAWHDGGAITADLHSIDARGPAIYAVGSSNKVLRWSGTGWIRER